MNTMADEQVQKEAGSCGCLFCDLGIECLQPENLWHRTTDGVLVACTRSVAKEPNSSEGAKP